MIHSTAVTHCSLRDGGFGGMYVAGGQRHYDLVCERAGWSRLVDKTWDNENAPTSASDTLGSDVRV